jgi:hypothetical protein
MPFFRSGQHDDRRRRVLTDEVIGAAGHAAPKTEGSVSAGALRSGQTESTRTSTQSHPRREVSPMDRQPRITELVPKSFVAFVLLFVAGLAIVGGLEALYFWMPTLAAKTHDGRIAAFDLDGEGSLAVWFSSATLALASMTALLVYSIRRHTADDYHGRYRVWVWASLAWLVMSIDEGASLHEGFKELMTQVTGQRITGDGSVWWICAYAVVLGIVGLRLILEMRSCRISTTAFLATAACYVTAVLAQLGWIMPGSGAKGVMLEEGCEMVGNLFLVLSMGLHARYVILVAQGVLPAPSHRPAEKPAKKLAAKSSESDSEDGSKKRWFRRSTDKAPATRRSDLAPAEKTVAAPAASSAAARANRYEDDDDEDDLPPNRASRGNTKVRFDDEDDSVQDRKLSRADRKAMRKHKEQSRRIDDDR